MSHTIKIWERIIEARLRDRVEINKKQHDFVPGKGTTDAIFALCCRRRLKGIHSRLDTNRIGAEGLSFYYPRLLNCLNQMLAMMLLSQHRVSSFKTVRPRAACGARCIRHVVRI